MSDKALVRKRSDTELMAPPPPVKKIKRPRKVLDEDSYTDALSHIIARDFFPGLLETEIQQEYLDAVESKDQAWISSAGKRLRHVMTPGRARVPASPETPYVSGGQTPKGYVGDTPATQVSAVLDTQKGPALDTNMSLSRFQATYTSEDNESFYKLVDKQNQKKADKYAWLWRGNKLPSKQMIKQHEVQDRLAQTRSLTDDGHKRDRLAIKDAEDRPARPDTWKSNPRNGLMFGPDGIEDSMTTAQKAEDTSRAGPRAIMYENTRIPQPHVPQRPPSPTMSAVRDAIAGKPRKQDQDSSVAGGGETPRVNGYSFVDEEDDEDDESEKAPPLIDLGPGDANNPFKVQNQRDRETLHERMVARIAKANKEASASGFTGKVDKTPVPKFPSSPKVSGGLTPAAQRLWSKIGSPRSRSGGGSFGQSTPMRPRGSLLKSVSRPATKDDR